MFELGFAIRGFSMNPLGLFCSHVLKRRRLFGLASRYADLNSPRGNLAILFFPDKVEFGRSDTLHLGYRITGSPEDFTDNDLKLAPLCGDSRTLFQKLSAG